MDLIEELRAAARPIPGKPETFVVRSEMFDEAADEIERLRGVEDDALRWRYHLQQVTYSKKGEDSLNRATDEAIQSAAIASATVEREADAERYRAICMRLRGVGGYTIGIIAQHAFSDDAQLLVGPEADAAIDAALAATRTASAESAEENLKP